MMLPTNLSRHIQKRRQRKEKKRAASLKMAYCYEKINATPKAVAAYRNAIRYGQANIQDRLSYARQLLKTAITKLPKQNLNPF